MKTNINKLPKIGVIAGILGPIIYVCLALLFRLIALYQFGDNYKFEYETLVQYFIQVIPFSILITSIFSVLIYGLARAMSESGINVRFWLVLLVLISVLPCVVFFGFFETIFYYPNVFINAILFYLFSDEISRIET